MATGVSLRDDALAFLSSPMVRFFSAQKNPRVWSRRTVSHLRVPKSDATCSAAIDKNILVLSVVVHSRVLKRGLAFEHSLSSDTLRFALHRDLTAHSCPQFSYSAGALHLVSTFSYSQTVSILPNAMPPPVYMHGPGCPRYDKGRCRMLKCF
jgi:hypothetical protein